MTSPGSDTGMTIDCGSLPLPLSLFNTLVGRPIHVTKNPQPTKDEVQTIQRLYIEELMRCVPMNIGLIFAIPLAQLTNAILVYGIHTRMYMLLKGRGRFCISSLL
jgi:Diacylglycerol acyltransferase